MLNIISFLRGYLFQSEPTESPPPAICSEIAAPTVITHDPLKACPHVKYFSQAEHELRFIWITPEIAPREPFNDDRLNNLKHTQQVLGPEWQIKLITNNKELIPTSVAKLSEIGIEVEEFSAAIPKPTTCKPNYDQQKLFRILDALNSPTLNEMYENLCQAMFGMDLYALMGIMKGDLAHRYGQYDLHKAEWERGVKKYLFGGVVDQVKLSVANEFPGLVADINTTRIMD